jgi:sorting nexin-1/2
VRVNISINKDIEMVESTGYNEQGEDLEVISDPTVFDRENEVSMNDAEFNYSVKNPQDNGGHIAYEVRGKDRQGSWECKRRFNEFFLLHEILQKRFPGIPIPIIPPKKAVGNKDNTFLQDRTFYLQRFLRKLSRFDFIIDSQEFQLFARPNGLNVEKALAKLMPMSTMQTYDRVKAVTNTEDDKYDLMQKEILAQKITEYCFFAKGVEPLLRKIKSDLSRYLMSKQRSMVAYKDYAAFIGRYEDLNLSHYTEMNSRELIFNNPDNKALQDSMISASGALKNPYIDLYHWVKGELYDLEAVREAIKVRAETLENTKKLEAKKSSTQKDLESVATGKTTVTTLFKNSSDANAMANKIENTDREILASEMLGSLLTIYLGDKVIPAFKKEKLSLYHRILKQFTVIEISNSHQMAGFWSNVLQNPKVS